VVPEQRAAWFGRPSHETLTHGLVSGSLPFVGTYGLLEVAGPVLDALGDPTRRAILETLRRGGPSSVGGLAERIPVSRPAISQHLKVLGAVGLVDHESRGTRHIYRVDRTGLDELRAWLTGSGTTPSRRTPTTSGVPSPAASNSWEEERG